MQVWLLPAHPSQQYDRKVIPIVGSLSDVHFWSHYLNTLGAPPKVVDPIIRATELAGRGPGTHHVVYWPQPLLHALLCKLLRKEGQVGAATKCLGSPPPERTA